MLSWPPDAPLCPSLCQPLIRALARLVCLVPRCPENDPPWAQWRLLHAAKHTWLGDKGCELGSVGENGKVGPIATTFDQQFCLQALEEGSLWETRGQQNIGFSLACQ